MSWKLRIWPSKAILSKAHSRLPLVILLLGLVMTALIVSQFYLAATARLRAIQTERANRELLQKTEALRKSEEALRNQTDELIRTREIAIEASRHKSDFLANMSHEIRTPMNAVLGMSELLSGTKLTREQKDYAWTIQYSASALLDIVNDILDFSKIEAGKLELEKIDFNLRELVKGAEGVFSPIARQKGIRFSTFLDPQAPTLLRGDPGRIRQILNNLLSNALKFTEKGKVELRITRESLDGANVGLLFEVTDTGVGIPAAARSRLFSAFSQADSSTTRKYGGTGLGLSISRRLVEMMGGGIDFESEEGKGSHFWFRVPFELGVAAPSEKHLRKRSTSSHSKRRILVVEDNRINQKVVLKLLNHLGYAADIAQNGRQALAAHSAEPYDLIVMDCQMPEMDGYETTAAIRILEGSGRRTPIIALTAHALAADRKKCLQAGMDDYLPKPIQLADLGVMVEKWLWAGTKKMPRNVSKKMRARRASVSLFLIPPCWKVSVSGPRKIRISFRGCSACF